MYYFQVNVSKTSYDYNIIQANCICQFFGSAAMSQTSIGAITGMYMQSCPNVTQYHYTYVPCCDVKCKKLQFRTLQTFYSFRIAEILRFPKSDQTVTTCAIFEIKFYFHIYSLPVILFVRGISQLIGNSNFNGTALSLI